ncbi:hypothetical protein KBC79_06095 [Candidatus Woesebacteria bacterium]|nr:hypothetical protein [Candidatus Woesebacteria bacterium]MBP9820274.1 hypothetical protein [Candidatus Woesebacteria bacterium]
MKQATSLLLLNYFRVLARLQLRKNKPLVIGVTGSAGKTTVMYAIAAVLEGKFSVKVSEKANSQSGLSLNILGLAPHSFSWADWLRLAVVAPFKLLTNWEKYQVYIAEMGIDSPDEPANMSYLLKIVKPQIGVFTSVTLVHAQAFDHLVSERDVKKRALALRTSIAREKAKIITTLPSSGAAVFNSDDSIIVQACASTEAPSITFGSSANAAIRLMATVWKDGGTTFMLKQGKNEAKIELKKYLLPEHYGLSFASAAAVGVALGISLKESARAISTNFVLPPGRATLIQAVNKATILDSSYNSAPAPLLDFFELLAQLKLRRTGKKAFPSRVLAILGDMRELGKLSGYEHTRVAKRAIEVLDAVYLVGPEMREHVLPVLNKSNIPAFWFASASQAARQLKNDLQPNDLLLVKSSQNTLLLEIAIEQLMTNPADASSVLCRRSTFWDRERDKLLDQE